MVMAGKPLRGSFRGVMIVMIFIEVRAWGLIAFSLYK